MVEIKNNEAQPDEECRIIVALWPVNRNVMSNTGNSVKPTDINNG